MAQKSNNGRKAQVKKKTATWNLAWDFFVGGCCAEFFLLLVRNDYIYGTLEQTLAWYDYLQGILYAGLGVLAVGLVLLFLSWRRAGWRRTAGWIISAAGAFLVLSCYLIRTYNSTAVTFLCILVPAVMLLGILWSLYDRECAWALTILFADAAALWICRKGLRTEVWHTRVLLGAAAGIVLAALLALLFRRADQQGGKLGSLRLLPEKGDPLAIYISCGVSALSLLGAMFSATVAYYALWVVAVVIFAIAVYYTVRQL